MVRADHSQRRLEEVRGFIDGLYGPDLHAKRVTALAGATLGVMAGASLAVAMIGQALAQARGLVTKHAVKQVDRLMSNQGIDVWDSFARWVPQQVIQPLRGLLIGPVHIVEDEHQAGRWCQHLQRFSDRLVHPVALRRQPSP